MANHKNNVQEPTQIPQVRQKVVTDARVQRFLLVSPQVDGQVLSVGQGEVHVHPLLKVPLLERLGKLDVLHIEVEDVIDVVLKVDFALLKEDVCVLGDRRVYDLVIRVVQVLRQYVLIIAVKQARMRLLGHKVHTDSIDFRVGQAVMPVWIAAFDLYFEVLEVVCTEMPAYLQSVLWYVGAQIGHSALSVELYAFKQEALLPQVVLCVLSAFQILIAVNHLNVNPLSVLTVVRPIPDSVLHFDLADSRVDILNREHEIELPQVYDLVVLLLNRDH